MSELEPLDKRLSLAWQALSPPDGLEARVRARLSTANGSSPHAPRVRQTASRWRALRASGAAGASIGALLLGLGVALGYLIPRAPGVDAPTVDAPTVDTPTVDTPIVDGAANVGLSASPTAPAPLPVRREPATPTRSHVAAAPQLTPTVNDGAELLLLERAERAVRAKNPALVLALTRELEQRYPRSKLKEERRSIELMARCQAEGPGADTAARLAGFLRQYPASAYSARIADECSRLAPTSPLTNPVTLDIDGVEGGNDVKKDSP